MKTKKLNFEDFASNELSRKQKMTVLGKGDPGMEPIENGGTNIVLTTTGVLITPTPESPGPGDGTGITNGQGRP